MTNGLAAVWENRREAVHGWSLSLMLHGVVGAAVLFPMTTIFVVPTPEPFRLNMSLLTPPPVEQQMVAHTPVSDPIVQEQRVERPPVEQQVVHKVEALKTPLPQRQSIQSQPVQSMPTPVPAQTSVKREMVKEQRSERPSVTQQVVQTTEIVATPTPVQQSVTSLSQPKAVHQAVTGVAQPTAVADRQTKKRTVIQPVAVVSSHEERVVESVPQRFEHISAIVTGAMSRSASRMQQPPVQSLVASHTVAPVQAVSRRVIHRTVVRRDVKQDPTPTTDYSWVANTLLEKVQRLKRYPSRARKREWEGTVELRVSIRADGEIHDIRVLESSGHQALDEEALNTVAMASPLALAYPLGRSIVMVDLPIRYKLN